MIANNTQWIFSILPDDLFYIVVNEWLEHGEDVVSFDSAICLKEFRQNRLHHCLTRVQMTVKIQSSSGLKGLLNWQEKRKTSVRNLYLLFKGSTKQQNDNLQFSRIKWNAFENLESLCIEFTNDKSEVRLDICQILSSMNKLLKLVIKNEFVSSVEIIIAPHKLPMLHPLQELNIEYVTIREKQVREILDWLIHSCFALRKLQLDSTNITHRLFLFFIQRFPLLTDIDYTNVEEDEDDGNDYDDDNDGFEDMEVREEDDDEFEGNQEAVNEETLNEAIVPSQYMKSVRLDTSMSLPMLVKVLHHCSSPFLEFLKLPLCKFNHILTAENDLFQTHIVPSWQHLRTLELNAGMTERLFFTIAKQCGPTLRSIKLNSETDFDDVSMSIVGQYLIHLEELHLIRCMHITDEGIQSFCAAATAMKINLQQPQQQQHKKADQGDEKLFALQKLTVLNCEQVNISSYHLLLDTFQDTLTSIVLKDGQVDISVLERLLLVDSSSRESRNNLLPWQQVEVLELWLGDISEDDMIGYPVEHDRIRFRDWPQLSSLELGYCKLFMIQFQQLLRNCPILHSFTGYGLFFLKDEEEVKQYVGGNKRIKTRRMVTVKGKENIHQLAEEGMDYFCK